MLNPWLSLFLRPWFLLDQKNYSTLGLYFLFFFLNGKHSFWLRTSCYVQVTCQKICDSPSPTTYLICLQFHQGICQAWQLTHNENFAMWLQLAWLLITSARLGLPGTIPVMSALHWATVTQTVQLCSVRLGALCLCGLLTLHCYLLDLCSCICFWPARWPSADYSFLVSFSIFTLTCLFIDQQAGTLSMFCKHQGCEMKWKQIFNIKLLIVVLVCMGCPAFWNMRPFKLSLIESLLKSGPVCCLIFPLTGVNFVATAGLRISLLLTYASYFHFV